MIRLTDVQKEYENGTHALRGVTMEVNDGEFVFLLGHSGAGKSTLLKLILREELPTSGKVLVTVSDRDKKFIEPIARDLISLGFQIVSTGGTAEYLRGQGVETEVVNKLHEGRPNLGDMITNKQIDLIINTPVDRTSMIDDSFIRMQSIQKKIPYMTTIAAAKATVEGIRSAQHVKVTPRSLQEYHS